MKKVHEVRKRDRGGARRSWCWGIAMAVAACHAAGCGSDVGDDTGGPTQDATGDNSTSPSDATGDKAQGDAGADHAVTPDAGHDVATDGPRDGADAGPDVAQMDAAPDIVQMEAAPDVSQDAAEASSDAKDSSPDVADVVDSGTDVSDASDAPSDQSADVLGDAGDAGLTAEAILSGHSAACLTCAQAGCAAFLDTGASSCTTIAGTATSGPALGQTRSSLCLATLSCVIPTVCTTAAGDESPCYCGTMLGSACATPGAANGPCKSAEENGLESTDPNTIMNNFTVTTTGGGRANALVLCLVDNVCDSCF
jgi:hypothetical protein